MDEEEGVEAPRPSHPAKDLWPSWPRGMQSLSEGNEGIESCVMDKDAPEIESPDCQTAREEMDEFLQGMESRHQELLARLDHQDAALRRIQQTLWDKSLNDSQDLIFASVHAPPSGFGQPTSWQRDLDPKDSKPSSEEKEAVLSFIPEVFHTFTEADMALRDRAAAVDGSISRQLYGKSFEDSGSKKQQISFWDEQRHRLRRFVNSPAFDMFFAIVVVTNSIFIGVEVEFGISSPGDPPVGLEIAQYVYAVLFAMELILRVGAFGFGFFWGSDWVWAWLDLVIVLISLVELVVDIIDKARTAGDLDSSSVGSFTGFKALRLIRITRLLKTLRVVRIFRFIMALRTLVTSIVFTLRSLFWALTLLVLIIYVFSVLLTQAVNNHLLDPANPPLGEEQEEDAKRYFGSLGQTMLSLFMSISGGVSWEEMVFPLQAISTVWVMVLLFYVSFTYFAVLNVVTGVFCQSAIDSAQNDHANVVHAMLANKEAHVEKIRSLFSQLGAEKTGVITYAMFEEGINSPAVCEYFETLGLDVWDAWSFFKLLDLDRGGSVAIDEFFKGCLRLRGQARGVDVGKLLHDQQWLIKNTGHFQAYMEVKIKQLTEMMSHLSGVKLDNSWTRMPSPE